MSVEQSGSKSKYPNDPDQTKWITLAKNGDRAAFCRIVEKYQRPVYNLCYHMLRETGEAEDAAQEVFLRAYVKLDTYDDQRQFSTWLFSIASHYCIDHWKKRRLPLVSWEKLASFQQGPAAQPAQPERSILAIETSEEVRHLLETLQADYRTVIILRYWHTMSYQEIAETLNISPSAVKSKLFRARKMMTQHWDHKMGLMHREERGEIKAKVWQKKLPHQPTLPGNGFG